MRCCCSLCVVGWLLRVDVCCFMYVVCVRCASLLVGCWLLFVVCGFLCGVVRCLLRVLGYALLLFVGFRLCVLFVVVHYAVFVASCLLLLRTCLLFGAFCLLFVMTCLCLLLVVCCLLFVVCDCSLLAVRCLMFVVCCLALVVCCVLLV